MTAPDEAPIAGRARRALLANTRHELRTPINAILGYSEMLLEDAGDRGLDAFAPDLRRIHAAANELLGLVDDLLDPAKTDTTGALDLEAFGANLRRDLRTPINTVIGYSEMLLEDAAEQGQEEIVPDLRRIHTAAERFLALINDVVRFSTTAPDALSTDFDDPVGSPLVRQAMTTTRALGAKSSVAPAGRFRGSLLIVDDNGMNRDVLARQLARQGHSVVEAAGGREAMELVAARPFDLILLDVMMPEVSGIEVLRRLKADAALRDIPVVMISALDELESVVRCIELGAEDYLPKPFNPTLLRARIDAGLEKKRLRDQEVDYLRQVARVTAAAAAVEAGTFAPDSLGGVAARSDALGQLARVFQRMVREVQAREERLKQQVRELRIEIDEIRQARKVAEITESAYFQRLQSQADDLRRIMGS